MLSFCWDGSRGKRRTPVNMDHASPFNLLIDWTKSLSSSTQRWTRPTVVGTEKTLSKCGQPKKRFVTEGSGYWRGSQTPPSRSGWRS